MQININMQTPQCLVHHGKSFISLCVRVHVYVCAWYIQIYKAPIPQGAVKCCLLLLCPAYVCVRYWCVKQNGLNAEVRFIVKN